MTNKTINPLAAAVGGVLVGAGTVAAIALSDRNYRKKVQNKIEDIKEKGGRAVGRVKNEVKKT